MSAPEVTVIDYGVGNLLSVQRGLEKCGARVILTSDPNTILNSSRVVLPGVGAFPDAMNALERLNLVTTLQEFATKKQPLLAICLGMQLLMNESDEFGLTSGLGLIGGRVEMLPTLKITGELQKIPHIGWSSLEPSTPNLSWRQTLLSDNNYGDSAYFLHSFAAYPINEHNRVADVDFGGHRISAVIAKDKITGCQFHPEKSGEVGLKILRRFCFD